MLHLLFSVILLSPVPKVDFNKTSDFSGLEYWYLLGVKMWLTKNREVFLGYVTKISVGHSYHPTTLVTKTHNDKALRF